MVGYMNQEALSKTLEQGQVHFFSRKRKAIWLKGETSGHIQTVKKISLDCDGDTLLIEVKQEGSACHKGYHSCFYRVLDKDGNWQVVAKKEFEPKDS
jgi:phosphoribosyl-AMP cyclohydrolase